MGAAGISDLVSQSLMAGMVRSTSQEGPAPVVQREVEPTASSSNTPAEEVIPSPPANPTARTLQHLLDCYARVANEERTQPKVISLS